MNREELTGIGFPYVDQTILLFEGGSKMYGTALEGKADSDIYGVFVEPPEKIVGIDGFEHFVHHSNEGERGEEKPEAFDICLYGLQKFASLAAKGNPSVLAFLFAEPTFYTVAWGQLVMNAKLFLAKRHVYPYLGYANDQLQRLYGARGQKNCNRPFLEAQHGYDTKYAMHILRLLLEAQELMKTGRLSFPNARAEWLLEVRNGKYKLVEIVDIANGLEKEALAAAENSALPEKVNRADISKFIAQLYRDHWDGFKNPGGK